MSADGILVVQVDRFTGGLGPAVVVGVRREAELDQGALIGGIDDFAEFLRCRAQGIGSALREIGEVSGLATTCS